MSRILIFTWDGKNGFESFEQGNNGWNWFAATSPEEPREERELVMPFEDYVNDARVHGKFSPGMPASMGLKNWAIISDGSVGVISVENGSELKATPGEYYVLACREIWQPKVVILRRELKSHGRDYCYISFE